MADESEFGPINLNGVEPDKLAMADATTEPRVSDDELGEFVNDFENDATAGLYFDQRVVLDLRDARATIASQAAELAEAREILAGTDAGSLPNDMPLARIAEIRMDERHKYLWQVRDTCTRAEAAEAALKAAREENERLVRFAPRKCAATLGTDPPQDCDAPFCGCNPAWQQAIEALQESGWVAGPEVTKMRETLQSAKEWAHGIAVDERVCGWVHREDYGLYCLLADCPVDFDAALTPTEAPR